ncbi:autotransporter outer membrane beta-barrel domain-containing protein [Mesorhizobium sp. WSM3860]|uniref:autotransporter family protein n=1 Tax=Mesorhizobium sp. WSM3860 TaxID=2029403 RepID=UPI001596CA80|nr:autotransporter outer membrane beta-barrel domain-containing protein [Mesorhizobium sp. WSM3860]
MAQTVIPSGSTVNVPGTYQYYWNGVAVDGTLSISNGGWVHSGYYSYVGTEPGTGTLSVDGAGSTYYQYDADLNVATAEGANAIISVTNGGQVYLYSNFNSGLADGATTTITVDGANSLFATGFQVGLSSAAGSVTAMTISNGGTFWARAYQCCDPNGSGVIFIGVNGTATVNVTGANSLLKADGAISIGSVYPYPYGSTGTGVLTLSNGGTVMAGGGYGGIYVATNAGSTGTINIGSAAGSAAEAPGYVQASFIQFGEGAGSIVLNHTSSDYEFSTVIDGGGSLTTLSGTTILTAANGYTGATRVNGGVLDVEGSIASSATTINSGGTLTGLGVVGDVTVASGGILAPSLPSGKSAGLTVDGDLTFQTGAIYQASLTHSTASIATVLGTATLAGTVLANFTPDSYTSKTTYDILSASSLDGAFSGVSSTNPNFSGTLSYSDTDVFLTTKATLGGGNDLSANQQKIADIINDAFNNGGTLSSGMASLFGLTGSDLTGALSQASGESATGVQQTTFYAMDQFLGVMTDPSVAGRGDSAGVGAGPTAFADEPMPYASTEGGERDPYDAMTAKAPAAPGFVPRSNAWASVFGGAQTTSSNAAAEPNGLRSGLYGTVVGADYRFSPDSVAGFALAGGGTSFSVDGIGNGRSDLFQAGAYVRHTNGPSYISAALAYGWQDVTTDRTVTSADRLHAEFNVNAWSGRIEGGYRFVAPLSGGIGVTPYAAGQFTTFGLPAYAEESDVSGGGAFALNYAAKTVADTRSELGLRMDKSFAMADGILTLRGRLALAHDFNPDRSVAATFQALPGTSFVVNGTAQAADSALVTATAEKKWLNGWTAAATFEGEVSTVMHSYAGKGAVRYAW